MHPQKQLHLSRLKDGLALIDDIRANQRRPDHPEFEAWRDRVRLSLEELFGARHDYRYRFSSLSFHYPRPVILGGGRRRAPQWTQRDQERWDMDLQKANRILAEAIEEFEAAPFRPSESTESRDNQPVVPPPITINVHNNVQNVVSQITSVEISQVLQELDRLGLNDEDRQNAETKAKELAKEVKGERRWPVMAKSVEALKALGKPVYEHVAIPLLLEAIKKQSGL